MAQGATRNKGELFIKRARQFNGAFLVSLSVIFVVCLFLYPYFSMPASYRLVLYVYVLQLISAVVGYGVSLLVRSRMFPVSMRDEFWSYTAVRRYFWSWVLLCLPFGIGFLFFLFAGNLSALVLGYLLSLCGLIVFRPRRGDVV